MEYWLKNVASEQIIIERTPKAKSWQLANLKAQYGIKYMFGAGFGSFIIFNFIILYDLL